MEIISEILTLDTGGHSRIYDITAEIQQVINQHAFEEGQASIFGLGSTTGISTLEYEPGLVKKDVSIMLEQLAPYGKPYEHNYTWGDDNGASHLRSFLVGTSLNIPFVEGRLWLGTWQQVVFVDFDTRPRNRKFMVQLVGKKR